MYLLSKYEEFKNKKIHIIGIYLQKVNIIALDNTVDIISQRQKSFKLQGYTINDISLIPMFDKTYDKSSYIQSLATLKNGGFSRYAKVLSSDEENELIHIGKPIEMDDEWFQEKLKELDQESRLEDGKIKEIVAGIVPTYKPDLSHR